MPKSLGVVAFPSGEAAVFLSSSNTHVALPQDERSVTTLFRVDANGKVQSAASVLPATNASGAFYRTRFYVPTSDNGLLVGGGYGPDPFNWWIGKFDAVGQRTWQAGPGPAYPEDVYGLAAKPDGSVSAIIQEVGQASGLSQWTVARFAADGTPQGRAPFNTLGTSFVFLPGFWVSAVDIFQTVNAPALVRLDEQGKVLGSAPWPFDQTRRLIADGDGVAAVVCAASGPLCFVVRAGVDGKSRWQSPAGSFTDIARTPDGQIVAVSWSADMLIGQPGALRQSLGVERLLQKLVDDLGVGLAAGRLHHLADEPAEQRGLGLVGRDLVRVGVDHRLDGGLDGAGVGDLLQAALLDQRAPGPCPSPPWRRTGPWRCGPRSCRRPIRSSSLPRCSALTGDSAIVTPRRFSMAKKSPVTQLAACLASRPLATVLEELRRLLLRDQHARIVGRQAVVADEAALPRVGQLRQRGRGSSSTYSLVSISGSRSGSGK